MEKKVVTLEALIERLKTMLAKKLKEADWQVFFIDNPFVLCLALGLPIMMVGDQISVGGRKFSDAGDKISDFVVKAAASGQTSPSLRSRRRKRYFSKRSLWSGPKMRKFVMFARYRSH